MTVDRVFDLLGGPTTVARSLGVPLGTVSVWPTRGRIPTWHHVAIVDMAIAEAERRPKEGSLREITYKSLALMHTRSRRVAAE